MNREYSRPLLTAASCAGYFTVGLVVSLTGVTLEAFGEQLSVSPTLVGSYFFAFIGVSTIVMLFVAGPLIDRFGQKPVLVAGSLICAAAIFLSGLVGSFSSACALMALLGVGSAGMNGGLNTLISHMYPDNRGQALNLVNIFFGLGAVFLPFAAGWLLGNLGLPYVLLAAALCCLAPAVMFLAARFPSDAPVERFSLPAAGRALTDPLVILFALVNFCYVGLEIGTGTWSRAAAVSRWQVQPPWDQIVLAGFWGSLVAGRLVAGTVLRHIREYRMVLACSAGALAGLAVFVHAPGIRSGAAALWFTGICFGPIFPGTIGSVGNSFRSYPGTIISIVVASGFLGAVVSTTVVGRISAATSLETAFKAILAGAVALLVLQALTAVRIHSRTALKSRAGHKPSDGGAS